MGAIPYWRLSGFYFFFFGSLGAMMPYWSLYLQTLGFDAQEIGELIAILLATRIIAPNIWGWLADRSGKHIALVRLGSFLAVLCFSGILVGQSYWWLAVIMGTFSFFWGAILPQFEVITLNYLGSQTHRYSQIRLWGSIGFIVAVVLFGWLFKHISIILLPTLLIGWFTCIWLTSLLVPERTTTHSSATTESFYQVLKQPKIIAFFLVCFLMQASHGPYYTFYSIHLENYDYSRDLIGQLWALGVIAEVGVFLIMHYFLTRFSLSHLLIISLSLTSIRWLFIGFYADSLTILLLSQLLHAASFGIFYGVSMQFISKHFDDCHLGKAQALYNSFGFGVGGTVGSWVSGYTWGNAGAQVSYLWATVLCGIAVWITWQWVSESPQKLMTN